MQQKNVEQFPQSELSREPHSQQHRRVATFRVGHLTGIEPLLRSMDVDPAPVFKAAGFELEDFHVPDRKLPFVKASCLIEQCVKVTGCENFGILLGEKTQTSDFGLVGFMVRSATTVGRALSILVDYLDLFDDAGYMTVDTTEQTAVIGYTIFEPGVHAVEQIYDMSMTVCVNTMRTLCGETWNPSEVLLPRTAPKNTKEYKRFFKAPLRFGAGEASIVFSSNWLEHQPPTADELLFRYLKSEADEIHQAQDTSLFDRLPKALSQGLLLEKFQAREIAAQLGLHERTLQRMLAESGTTYRQELDTIRFTLGQQMLETTSMTVGEIAEAIGYGSSSAFIRAFQRWADISPGSWRKLNRKEAIPHPLYRRA